MKIEQFLIDNRKYLNLSEIEAACSLSNGTINHFIKGKRKLTEPTINKLNQFFSNWFNVAPIEQTKQVEQIIKPAKQTKPVACVNINDYKLLFSGKYQNKQGNKVILNKIGDKYYLVE